MRYVYADARRDVTCVLSAACLLYGSAVEALAVRRLKCKFQLDFSRFLSFQGLSGGT